MANTKECALVREQLAEVLDGEIDPSLQDHVIDCDSCRDLRHEARVAADAVKVAGADYIPMIDLESRILAVLDSRVVAAAPVMETPSAVASNKTPPHGTPVFVAKTAEMPASAMPVTRVTEVVAVPKTQAVPSSTQEVSRRVETRSNAVPRSARFWIVGGLLAASAAAMPVLIRARLHANTTSAHPTTEPVTVAARDPWHGTLAVVSRASADRTGGVELKLPGSATFVALSEGAQLTPGSELRTDSRTRARIDLADGTRMVMDRATDVRLDLATARGATLVSGALVADVAHIEDAPNAHIALPNGTITVIGTKFSLTAADDRSTVRVTRGTVRLGSRAGQEVDVRTGEEGVLAGEAVPVVSPAVNLASAVSWSELGEQVRQEPDAPIVGLGELRARRPGQTQETDHHVSLASHTVRVRIVGNMARTEIDETFRNDTGDELEGIYRFPLPPEAQIEKLALDIHGTMQDGEFIDRQRASAIWRGVIRNAVHPILQAQQSDELVWVPGPWRDPALLEWQRGGRFELRIFPIPAHGSRRVAIAYTQSIAASGGVRRYTYPLAHDANGSTRVEQFDVDVQVLGNDPALGVRARGYPLTLDNNGGTPGATHLTFEQGGFVPAGDLVLEYALPDRNQQVTAWGFQPPATVASTVTPVTTPSSTGAVAPAVPEPSFVAIALRPELPRWSESRPRDYAIVVDTSRSMVGERLARASRLAAALVAEMDPRDRVGVLACDTTCREMPGGLQFAGAQAVHATESFLNAEEAMGGSDLVAQVRAASALIQSSGERDGRIVYLGDGAATVGYRRPELVAAVIAETLPASRASLTTVALGSDADTTLLGAMARAGGGVSVPYVPGESLQTAALSALEATYGVALRDPVLTLPIGLTEISPTRLNTIRAGSEAMVVARMSDSEVRGDAVLRGTVSGEPFEAHFPIDVRASTAPGNSFVPRLFAATRIAELESEGSPNSRTEIVDLSQRFHVASRYTSLLVLESEAMYRAFGVTHGAANNVAWTGEDAAEPTADLSNRDHAAAPPTVPTDPSLVVAGAALPTEIPSAETVVGSDETERMGMGGLGLIAGHGAAGSTRATAGPVASNGDMHRDDDPGDSTPMADTTTAPAPTGTTPTTVNAAPASAPMQMAQPTMSSAVATPTLRPAHHAFFSAGAGGAGSGGGAGASTQGTESGLDRSRDGSNLAVGRRSAIQTGADNMEFSPRQRGEWMRRVWVRHASISGDGSARSGELAQVGLARTALESMPDSKTRHQELYRWLSVAGQFDEASEIATRWSTRDALDPDAITRLADVAARHGDRARSVRILAGIVDVRPDDVTGQKRLALLHERAGEIAEACAYRVSLSQIQTNDVDALVGAMQCEQALGHAASASRLMAGIADEAVRARVTHRMMVPASLVNASVSGDLVVSANWDLPADLDIAIIDSQGKRLSWMGGRMAGLSARGAQDLHAEALGLGHASTGDYVIEISRTSPNSRLVTGRVDVSVIGEHRTVAFALPAGVNTARVARIAVTRESRLVPANGG